MKKIMYFFLPKERELYDLFKELSSISLQMAEELGKLLNSYDKIERADRKSKSIVINHLKLKAESINDRIIERVFGLKQDKELLEKLSSKFTKACKLISSLSSSLIDLSVERVDDYMLKFSEKLLYGIKELNSCILHLEKRKDVKELCKNIHKLEKDADEIYSKANSELFHFYKNSMDVLKFSKIYDVFEILIDKIDECAFIIERIER